MPLSSISMGGGGGGGGVGGGGAGGGATLQRHMATTKSYDEFDEFFDGPAKPTHARAAKPTGLLPAGAASRAPPPLRPLGEPMKLAAGVSALGSGVSQISSNMGSTMGAMAAAMGSACPPLSIAPPPSPAPTKLPSPSTP